MNIIASKQASEWFKRETGVGNGRGVRFSVKVYGHSPIHDNFSLAMEINTPSRPAVQATHFDVMYYIEENDAWFFNGYDLEIGYDEKKDEPIYHYHKLDN